MKKAILLLLFIVSIYSKAQTIQFIDRHTSSPVSYASISWNGVSTFTDEYGKIDLGSTNAKHIKFTHICYRDTVINDIKGSPKVYVSPKAYTLDNISIFAKSNKKNILQNIGYTKYKSKSGNGGKNGLMMAVYIANSNINKDTYIHSILACLDYINEKIKNRRVIDAELRFDIRCCAYQNGKRFPGNKSYIKGGIVYKGQKKSGMKTISLEQPIIFPKEGVFVTVEWICPGKLQEEITNAGVKTTTEDQNIQTYIKEHGSWILLKYTESEKRFCKEYFNGKYRNLKVGLQVSR